MKLLYQLTQHTLLFWRAGVDLLAQLVKPTLIAYPDAVSVVRITVGTLFLDGSPRLNGPVPAHHIVVADAFPRPAVSVFSRLMPQVNLCRRTRLVRPHR